jgi:hypothetical protein
MHVWVGKLRGSNQRMIAPTKGNKNAFLPFTLNIGQSDTCTCSK